MGRAARSSMRRTAISCCKCKTASWQAADSDLYAIRTHNSLGILNDGDDDGWRWGYELTMRFQGPGSPAHPHSGARVIRTEPDGHATTYRWNAARAAYISTEGTGAYDELRYESGAGEWVWTGGSTRVTERYSNSTSSSMTGRLIRRTDTSGNSIVLMYDSGRRAPSFRMLLRAREG
jgi:hypothetical protein